MSCYSIHIFNKNPYLYYIEEKVTDNLLLYNSTLYIQDTTVYGHCWYRVCFGILENPRIWYNAFTDPDVNSSIYMPRVESPSPIWWRTGYIENRLMLMRYGEYSNIELEIDDGLV